MIVGDLNSRISNQSDYVDDDYDNHINVLPDDYVRDQNMPRKSQDAVINANGYILLNYKKKTILSKSSKWKGL